MKIIHGYKFNYRYSEQNLRLEGKAKKEAEQERPKWED